MTEGLEKGDKRTTDGAVILLSTTPPWGVCEWLAKASTTSLGELVNEPIRIFVVFSFFRTLSVPLLRPLELSFLTPFPLSGRDIHNHAHHRQNTEAGDLQGRR